MLAAAFLTGLMAASAAADVSPEHVAACVATEEDHSMELLQLAARKENATQSEGPGSVFCEKVPACEKAKLEGYCCPSASGTNLGCCFSGQVAEQHSCLTAGRAGLASCPASGVSWQDLSAKDVEALCLQDCKDGLIKLSTECRVTSLPKMIQKICSDPPKYAAKIKKFEEQLHCVNSRIVKSTVCPPHFKIIKQILQKKYSGDMNAVCNAGCIEEMHEVTRDCESPGILRVLTNSCTSTASLLASVEDDELNVEELEELAELLQ